MIDSVAAEDQEQVRSFFHDFCQKRLYGPDAKAPQITYRVKSTDGNSHQYIGTFIKVDDSVGLYCCRQMPDTAENVALRMENDHLRENVKELLTHFVDGFAAFEISADGLAKLLYTSENVYEFFGYTEEEWLGLMQTFTPIDNFIANCEGDPENVELLLRTGEAEFIYRGTPCSRWPGRSLHQFSFRHNHSAGIHCTLAVGRSCFPGCCPYGSAARCLEFQTSILTSQEKPHDSQNQTPGPVRQGRPQRIQPVPVGISPGNGE